MKDEKICPLTQRNCYRGECGMWSHGECAVLTLAIKAEEMVQETYWIRKELEDR